jgi:hypothetical protein
MPYLSGPIDDTFLEPFLVVIPSDKSSHPAEQEWIDFELNHFRTRWKALMRGDLRMKKDADVTAEDVRQYNMIAWGTPESNRVLAKTLNKLPIKFDGALIQLGERKYRRGKHVPAFIFPNPLNPKKYLVLNSGLTFREAHDKTNSQQNPKLPDWAIIDITQPPDASAPGKIADAGFFDEWWKVK